MTERWVYCPKGQGYQHDKDKVQGRRRHFPKNSVGIHQRDDGGKAVVWLIGPDETWSVPADEIETLDVLKTGKGYKQKICNKCHCLLNQSNFARNQNNKHGVVRRPTCKQCRTDIDKRAPKSRQAKQFEKRRPKRGAQFKCPICQKRSIAGITAKIVADHNHHTGDIRDFICDSCNTGLGRFKNGVDCLKDAVAYIEDREGDERG